MHLDFSDLIAVRRDLHAHPELAFAEKRTTDVIVAWLRRLGLTPQILPAGTGVVCDIGGTPGSGGVAAGGGTSGPVVVLRADIDALPIQDLKTVPYRSTVDGACHGCGHDAHTAILLGAASELAPAGLPGTVRLLFQPAEETAPGGALTVISAGVLDGAEQIYALHCDPRLETGQVGLRVGPITAAFDEVEVVLTGPGGHTARPQLTADLVHALGLVITELPGLLSRRVDPRSAMSLVWGSVEAGRAMNVIPSSGRLRGTLRMLDRVAWGTSEALVRELVAQVVAPTGTSAELAYRRGVPPVVNDAAAVGVQRSAVLSGLGPQALTDTEQSMGGEDFGWYLDSIPGALARLGVRRPGVGAFDLHQGTFDIDEDALDVGVRYTVALAKAALTMRPR